ncbi:MAG TPA: amidase [Deltaproteobacteria bacterium]|nr:amidase [Deltaproteobacteria bacterium]
MSVFQEYDHYDAVGLAELVRSGEISPEELCEEAIQRIERFNPSLNAVICRMYDHARKSVQSGLPKGPFSGVPFLIKDLVSSYAGAPMTKGCKAFRNYIPDHDSELMKRYRRTGVVILGKTNTPEFGLMGVTEPELHGPTRNPWDAEHTPGGSSGGSAAAVACGMVPMASGGDGGGSIRIPSSYCGLFGLKPSRGRNPTGPDHGQIWQGAAVEHVLTRTVRDSAAMLDAVNGPAPGDPYEIPRPERPYLDEITRSPGALRIGFTTASPLNTPVHPECVKAVNHAARLLESLGHKVEESGPQVDGAALARSYFMMYFGEIAADIEEMRQVLGRKAVPEDVEGPTWTLNLLGRAYSAGEFVSSLREWNRAARAMGDFHRTYDLLLIPTTAYPPVKIGELKPSPAEEIIMKITNRLGLGRLMRLSGIVDRIAIDSLAKTPFTQLANLTGQPAMSVPLHWTAEGLPCGVQFIASFGNEACLFRLAAQLEEAQPWFDRRPEMTYKPDPSVGAVDRRIM